MESVNPYWAKSLAPPRRGDKAFYAELVRLRNALAHGNQSDLDRLRREGSQIPSPGRERVCRGSIASRRPLTEWCGIICGRPLEQTHGDAMSTQFKPETRSSCPGASTVRFPGRSSRSGVTLPRTSGFSSTSMQPRQTIQLSCCSPRRWSRRRRRKAAGLGGLEWHVDRCEQPTKLVPRESVRALPHSPRSRREIDDDEGC